MRRTLIFTAAAAVALSGCGNKQTTPPDTGKIAAPGTFVLAGFPKDGLTLKRPGAWSLVLGTAPQVATVSSGDAQIVIWHYPRSEPLPVTRAQLGAARTALLRAIKQRDPKFRLKSSRIVVKPTYVGIELVGIGTNEGARREARSLHVFGNASEIVVDEFAPTKDFARVDNETFGSVARSLRLIKPGAAVVAKPKAPTRTTTTAATKTTTTPAKKTTTTPATKTSTTPATKTSTTAAAKPGAK